MMTEQEWLSSDDLGRSLLYSSGKMSGRKLRLFACACCRQVWDQISDAGTRTAVEVAERYADGLASQKELIAANDTVSDDIDVRSDAEWIADLVTARNARAVAHNVSNAVIDTFLCNVNRNETGAKNYVLDYTIFAKKTQTLILRDIVGNPFKPVTFQPHWKTHIILQLAQTMYDDHDFTAMPVLGDALEEAGCNNDDILTHCRSGEIHVRGCWVVDLILGKK